MFYYLDPPFWAKSERLYRKSFNEPDHERLAEALNWVTDKFLLSYDAAPEIIDLYSEHRNVTVTEIDLLYTGTARSAGREIVISTCRQCRVRHGSGVRTTSGRARKTARTNVAQLVSGLSIDQLGEPTPTSGRGAPRRAA